MAFISELMNRPVTDLEGERIGTLHEILAIKPEGIAHPQVTAIMVKHKEQIITIPISDVVVLIPAGTPLNKRFSDLSTYTLTENDLYLVRDILDKQIIDVNGIRVVRVNDLEVTRVNNDYFISNVDISGLGLMRRVGLFNWARRLGSIPQSGKKSGFISWDDVELLPGNEPMRLRVPGEKLAELHPADLAEIISDLSREKGSQFINSLDVKVLAETLEEVETDFQASLVEKLSDEKVADVLEEMSPDEAADLLAELPEERSEDILKLMQSEEAEDVRHLLTFPEDSSGGIMTTEYVDVRPNLSAAQVLQYLRTAASDAETIYYIYVTDNENHLLGVFSLRQLVLSDPDCLVQDFMEDRVISVQLLDSQEHTAQIISKYNLLAVPVVDEQDILHGIVTADDALDKIIPTAWKKRLPRIYH